MSPFLDFYMTDKVRLAYFAVVPATDVYLFLIYYNLYSVDSSSNIHPPDCPVPP